MRSTARVYGIAAVGLGAVALAFRDMPLYLQRVPTDLPGRSTLAMLWALALLLTGALAIFGRWRTWSCLALACSYALYAFWFSFPQSRAAAFSAGGWLAFFEVAAMASGGVILWSSPRADKAALARAARVLVGFCAVNFSICHFVYDDITAGMVPQWLPAHHAWAYFTGLGHGLAGVALISGIRSKLAAMLEAVMCWTFVALVHVPAVATTPGDHGQWAMLTIAFAIGAGVWAARLAPERRKKLVTPTGIEPVFQP